MPTTHGCGSCRRHISRNVQTSNHITKTTQRKMRSNIVSEAGLPTRLGQWWGGIPFLTSSVVIVCGVIYLVCLLVGYDSFAEVCFWPSAVISRFQVYRIYTSVLFHGSLLHVLFNMMALVPLGSELERVMGSVRMLYIIILLATSNAIFHLLIALLAAHNPLHSYQYLMNECAIGFSGILFSMIVIETSLSGVQYRSVFGLFNVPAKWYAWILLVVFQLVMTNVSLLGHLCGILSGFAYTYGLFNFLLPGTSFYSAIESSSWISACVRRPKFMLCTGGNPSSYIPTYSSQNTTSSGLLSGNIWRNLSSWMPQRDTTAQPAEDGSRFPGRGRSLGSVLSPTVSTVSSDSSLQARLLDNGSSPNHQSDQTATGAEQQAIHGRLAAAYGATAAAGGLAHNQGSVVSEEEIQKLVAMGFERTQVEVAVAAADGDLNVAVEILMTQLD
ncbi:Rhomboid-like protein 15 [Sarracenia purpurea var. burkii]